MVMEWGMSDKLGRVRYQSNEQEVFLGHSVARSTNISEETARLIDAEIRRLVEDGEQEARRILLDYRGDWEKIAQGLLEFETLTGEEIKDLINGKKPNRESVLEPTTPRASAVPPAGKPRPRPDPDPGLEPQPQA
jgi:cell division protease FtsH